MLDEFSALVAERLFAVYPGWRALAREEGRDAGRSHLAVAVEALASACVERGLVIYTPDGEIIVCFDCGHVHFEQGTYGGVREDIDRAMEFVAKVLNEDVVVVSRSAGGHLRVSTCIESGVPWSEVLQGVPGDHIRVRSWRGTHNSDIDL